MKRMLWAILAFCLLLSGCGAQVKSEDEIDFRPAMALAEECFENKMQAEGVKLYKITDRRASVRTGSDIFEVEFEYAVNGREKETYLYRIQSTGGVTQVLQEGETLPDVYIEN